MELIRYIFFYLIPAAVLVGIVGVIARLRKQPRLFSFEFVAWVLPGVLYWSFAGPFDLERFFPKTLGNMLEPTLVAVVVGLLFGLRVLVGARTDRLNLAAAWSCVVLSNLAAVGVFTLVPPLPE